MISKPGNKTSALYGLIKSNLFSFLIFDFDNSFIVVSNFDDFCFEIVDLSRASPLFMS